MKQLLLLAILTVLVSCKAPIKIGDPSYTYNVTYTEYFAGINADLGVEFDVTIYNCIDGFVYIIGDTTASLGECNPAIFTRVNAVKE